MAICERTGDRYDRRSADTIRAALAEDDEHFMAFLISNELWGGSGSVADQACTSSRVARTQVEEILIRLGRIQIGARATNVRTEMWVSAFERWRAV
jgi:hypothetical protein